MSAQSAPRTAARVSRGAIVVLSGLSFGVLSGHMIADARPAAAGATAAAESAQPATTKPHVVTVVRTKHVKSDPIIVYRQVPVAPSGVGSTGAGYTNPAPAGGSSSGQAPVSSGGGAPAPRPAPAPAPAPQPAPKPATSTAS